jgi:multiple sugar transport system substrate-binding protein
MSDTSRQASSFERTGAVLPRRDLLRAGGAALLAASMAPIAACGGGGEQPSKAATPDANPNQKVTVNFWNWWGIDLKPLMDQIIQKFEQRNPNITINNTVRSWDRRSEQVLTALAGGHPPEVLMATRQEIVKLADAGQIAPITAYARAAHVDLGKFYPSEIKSMWWKGQLYSMPMPTAGGETGMLWYARDVFSQSGLDPSRPPRTWKDLEQTSRAITKRNGNGSIKVLGVNIGGLGSSSAASFVAWLYCNSGTLFSPDMKKVAFDGKAGQQTLRWMVGFVKDQYGGAANYADFMANQTPEAGQYPFYQGRIGMDFFNVSGFFQISKLAPGLKYAIAPRPYNDGTRGARSQGVAGLSFGWGYVIPKGLPRDVEPAAYRWVQEITYQQDGACAFMLQQQRPSPLKACNENPDYQKANPFWAEVKDSLSRDVSIGIVPPQAQILDKLGQNVSAAIYGQMSPEDALQQAARTAQVLLDQYWKAGR